MYTLCVLGPTGVGKTESAEKIAHLIDGEIINMDVGQMYTACSIGTAKPAWQKNSIPHHLFDIIDKPVDYSVACYRNKMNETIRKVHEKGKVALIVGGSLFYLQSLLFALHESDNQEKDISHSIDINWESLNTIDPIRAKEIHPKDSYRIRRALTIWYTTGKKPSEQKPFWSPVIQDIHLLWLYREKEDLHNRIYTRVDQMMQMGWYEEVCGLADEWKQFVFKKKLCGYDILVDAWKKQKQNIGSQDKEKIKKETINYAKRQMVFWRGLKKKCALYQESSMNIQELNLTFHSIDLYLEQIRFYKGFQNGQSKK